MAVTQMDPFAATWLQREDRTSKVRLTANPDYWDKDRGPRLREVVLRNDLTPEEALDLVCTTEGEVDVVTEVSPADAEKAENSEHAELVSTEAIFTVAGVINRDAEGLPLADRRARLALNLAVDRERLVRETMFGRATPLAGLTPPAAVPEEGRLKPHSHDPGRAAELWNEARSETGGGERPLRVAALGGLEDVARAVAADLEGALSVGVEVVVYRGEEELPVRRRLAEKKLAQGWDVLILGHGAQFVESVVAELHRAFVGATGEFRAGPTVPEFESLFAELAAKTAPPEQAEVSQRIDRLVRDESLALSLCAPRALYAVNKHVDFTPYRTSFEFAETSVDDGHWSRR